MVQTVNWSNTAIKDLENIVDYIYHDSPTYALAFYSEVKSRAKTLTDFPLRGRVVPELQDQTIREIFVHRYRLIYKIEENNISIATIVHGAREFKPQGGLLRE
jgi:addiction module RelE/StbE family toxin